jgi:hypothetical protein
VVPPWNDAGESSLGLREGGPSAAPNLYTLSVIAELQQALAAVSAQGGTAPSFHPTLARPCQLEQAVVDRDALAALLRQLEHGEKAHAAAVVAACLATQSFLVSARV